MIASAGPRKTPLCCVLDVVKGALDNFSLIPNFFSKKLRFLYH